MSVRFLHLADLHLGADFDMLGPRAPERRQDLLDAFVRAVDFAVNADHRIDAVLVAGDVFDVHDPDPGLVGHVKAQARRLAEAGLPVYWIPGTHDRYDDPRCVYRHDDFPGVTLFTEPRYTEPLRVTVRDVPLAISGYAYQHRLSPKAPLADLPDLGNDVLHIALLHGSVQAGITFTVEDHYVPVPTEALAAAPVHYVALGHYHNTGEWPTARGVAYYPGTLEGRRFGENGERFLTVVELDPTWPRPRIERHAWNRRTLRDEELDLDLTAIGEPEGVVAWLRERADADVIQRVTLTGTAEWDVEVDALAAQAAEHFFHLTLRDRSAIFESGRIAEFADERSVRGEFVRRLRARLETASREEAKAVELALKLGVQAFAGS